MHYVLPDTIFIASRDSRGNLPYIGRGHTLLCQQVHLQFVCESLLKNNAAFQARHYRKLRQIGWENRAIVESQVLYSFPILANT